MSERHKRASLAAQAVRWPEEERVPFAPIEDYMSKRHLTVQGALPIETICPPLDDTSRTSAPMSRDVIPPDLKPAYSSWMKLLRRSRERGWMLHQQVDDFCCNVLRIHPSEAYGDAWFDFGLEAA